MKKYVNPHINMTLFVSFIYSVLVIISLFTEQVYSKRLHEQIYSNIEGGAACFRRLNGTHQVGCSSDNDGHVGIVLIVNNISDAQWLVSNSTAGPYMAVVSTALFQDVVELFMSKPEVIAGILLYDSGLNKAKSFSQDSRCPNEYASGPESTCSSSQSDGKVWNENGTGLLRRDIPFSMFYLPQSRAEEIEKIRDCYTRYNLNRNNHDGQPLCSIQMNTFMFAAINSEVCMRRSASSALMTSNKVCDPLGDHNVFYSLFPRIKVENKKGSIILVTARMDSASLFDGVSPGAASSVVGLVTLVAAATTLSKMIPVNDFSLYDTNILWTMFNGESFDYIGSQRVAYDIANGAWPPNKPLRLEDIKFHFEIGQIGGALSTHNDTSWPMYGYTPPTTNAIPQISEFLNLLNDNIETYNMSITLRLSKNLPPTSIHSFRRILSNVTETGQLPELVMVDHDATFTNMFYNSALDEYEKIGFVYRNISVDQNGTFITTEDLIKSGKMKEKDMQVKIARLATGLARTLFQRVTGAQYTGNITASAHLVDEMLYCLVGSQSCQLAGAAAYGSSGDVDASAPRAPPLYVGVATWTSTPALLVGNVLALLTGQKLSVNRSVCEAKSHSDFSYHWLKGWNHSGVCIETTMNFSQAVSPAFIKPHYDMRSGEFSTWTESVWQSMWARVFVSAGGWGARAAALSGSLATVAALLLTHFINSNADFLFGDHLIVSNDVAAGMLRRVNC